MGAPARPLIRPEVDADADAIRAVHDAAFEGPEEGLIVERLRPTDRFLPGLSLVAEIGGLVVGHCLFSRADLVGGGRAVGILALGPIAVVPSYQRRGLGEAMIRAGLEGARALGVPIVVVLGHPSYYPRFGFEPARALGIEAPAPWPDEAWMALRLSGWTPSMTGRVVYAEAFGPL